MFARMSNSITKTLQANILMNYKGADYEQKGLTYSKTFKDGFSKKYVFTSSKNAEIIVIIHRPQ